MDFKIPIMLDTLRRLMPDATSATSTYISTLAELIEFDSISRWSTTNSRVNIFLKKWNIAWNDLALTSRTHLFYHSSWNRWANGDLEKENEKRKKKIYIFCGSRIHSSSCRIEFVRCLQISEFSSLQSAHSIAVAWAHPTYNHPY